MSSFFKLWAKKTLTEAPKRKPTISGGWFGIMNGFNNLSEVQSSRGMAEITLSNRGDKRDCRIVPVAISFPPEAEVKEHLQPKEKPKRKPRKKK